MCKRQLLRKRTINVIGSFNPDGNEFAATMSYASEMHLSLTTLTLKMFSKDVEYEKHIRNMAIYR